MTAITARIPDAVMELLEDDKTTISPVEAGKLMGISDAHVRALAESGQLNFPFVKAGKWIRIPKIPFLQWLGYDVSFAK